MSLLSADAITYLLEEGKTPDADHVPVLHLVLSQRRNEYGLHADTH